MANQDSQPSILKDPVGAFERATGLDVPSPEEIIDSIPTPPEIIEGVTDIFNQGINLLDIHVLRPMGVHINSPFSSDHRPRHGGIDMATGAGTPVGAIADGRAIMVRDGRNQSSTYGNVTAFDHCNGNFITVNAHALDGSISIRPGETVRAGQEFMGVGSTGRSTGPHLHFETWVRGHDDLLYRVNPELVFDNNFNMQDENVREQLIRQTMEDFGKTRAQLRPLMSNMIEDCLRRNGTYDPTSQEPTEIALNTTEATTPTSSGTSDRGIGLGQ